MPTDPAQVDGRNALSSLAIRVETDHPILAAALVEALRPTLEDGVLEIRYGPSKRANFDLLKRHEPKLARYTDHELRIVTTE